MGTEKQNHFIRFLLDGKREASEEELRIRAEGLGLTCKEASYLVIDISPDYSVLTYGKKDEYMSEMVSFTKSFFLKNALNAYVLLDSFNNLQVLISGISNDSPDIELLCTTLYQKLISVFALEIFIGIGSVVERLVDVSNSAADAYLVLAYKYQYADKGVINISNIIKFQHNASIGPRIAFDRVVGCFQDGDLGRMERRLNELVETIRQRTGVSGTSIRRTLIELSVRLLNVASYSALDVESALEGRDPYHWILEQNHTEVIVEWIMQLAGKLLALMESGIKANEMKTISVAKEYIDANFTDHDISLQSVAEQVGLTSSYFSQFFKSETGTGFLEYVTGKRIERAKTLLETTGLKTEDIAYQTGFSSSGYFTKVFSKYVGMSPGKYRKNLHK